MSEFIHSEEFNPGPERSLKRNIPPSIQQIPAKEPKLKDSCSGIYFIDDIEDDGTDGAQYLLRSGNERQWATFNELMLTGTPTAKLYVKAFNNGVKFGSGCLTNDYEKEDDNLEKMINKEFEGHPFEKREFQVESILAKRNWYGYEEYLVKWVSFPREEATWEPFEYLTNASTMRTIFNSGVKRGISLLAAKHAEINEFLSVSAK